MGNVVKMAIHFEFFMFTFSQVLTEIISLKFYSTNSPSNFNADSFVIFLKTLVISCFSLEDFSVHHFDSTLMTGGLFRSAVLTKS